jgi:hypothetical protein
LHYWVDWAQRQPTPAFLLPSLKRLLGLRRSSNTSGSSINEHIPLHYQDENDHAGGGSNSSLVFCIHGLDRVVFGTTAAADCVFLMGIQPPRYLWYMLSGAMCDVFQLAVDISLHLTLFTDNAALCWMFSFMISIVMRHTSHRYLVFGMYVPNYWQSLGRMYAGYSFSIVLSTLFNYLITRKGGVAHYVAYVFTLLWTGLANYFILKKLWRMGGPTVTNNSNITGPTALLSSSTASPTTVGP